MVPSAKNSIKRRTFVTSPFLKRRRVGGCVSLRRVHLCCRQERNPAAALGGAAHPPRVDPPQTRIGPPRGTADAAPRRQPGLRECGAWLFTRVAEWPRHGSGGCQGCSCSGISFASCLSGGGGPTARSHLTVAFGWVGPRATWCLQENHALPASAVGQRLFLLAFLICKSIIP